VKKEESDDDEEEGRSSAFKSKRARGAEKKSVQAKPEGGEEDDEALQTRDRVAEVNDGEAQEEGTTGADVGSKKDDSEDSSPRKRDVKRAPGRQKAKPTSFLDEILAERSKKKKNKSKSKNKSPVT